MTILEKIIINELKLSDKIINISPIDTIKILLYLIENKNFLRITTNVKKTELEHYILGIINNKYFFDYNAITNNYFNNIILDIYFILANPFLFEDEIFNILLNNIYYIKKIPSIIDNLISYVSNNDFLKPFFNSFIYNRWLESLDFEFITEDKYKAITKNNNLLHYKKYVKLWGVFQEIIDKVKIIIVSKKESFMNLHHVPGCFNLSRDFYKYCVELNTGLPISKIGIYKIFKWGIQEVNKIKRMMRELIIKLEPEYKDLCFTELIKIINSKDKYKYKSKEEFIEDHNNKLKEITEFLVNKKKLPLLVPAKIIDFSEKNLADGYWFRDAFYLNTINWNKIERFTSYALILHETIPGHHMQISYELHSNKNSLFMFWYNCLVNGFAEGWALFSEKLGNNYSEEDLLGVLSYNLLRSLRIIADISIHYYGVAPEDMIELFKNYLPMNDRSIETEIYRYVSLPGQALGYKLGDSIFKAIFYKKFKRLDNLLGDDAIELYKELITEGSIPLELLCKKYDIDIKELFETY